MEFDGFDMLGNDDGVPSYVHGSCSNGMWKLEWYNDSGCTQYAQTDTGSVAGCYPTGDGWNPNGSYMVTCTPS